MEEMEWIQQKSHRNCPGKSSAISKIERANFGSIKNVIAHFERALHRVFHYSAQSGSSIAMSRALAGDQVTRGKCI
jgi:hypothetical protein